MELLKVARAVWPFSDEPLDMGVEDGIVWAVCRAPHAGVNGYAMIPAEGHPWSAELPCDSVQRGDEAMEWLRVHHDELMRTGGDVEATFKVMQDLFPERVEARVSMDDYLDVHGGVTYHHLPWVGFDTGHAWDYWPPECRRNDYVSVEDPDHEWTRRWTVDMVIEEAKKLARQVAELGRGHKVPPRIEEGEQ